MYKIYRTLTLLISPFIPLLLKRRAAKGKEDKTRLEERFGIATVERPQGDIIWIHAASVGEANSVLPLIDELLAKYPQFYVLLTTVTVTSAVLVMSRLNKRAIHQFAPVDTPKAVKNFLDYWKPKIALFVDSELWANMIIETKKTGAFMGLINAKMSEKSFRNWQYAGSFIKQILSCFSICFAGSKQDAERLIKIGIPTINKIGNLKYEAPPLPCNEQELIEFSKTIGHRPVWLAASTHIGEEEIILETHKALRSEFPDLLTIIVPRHAIRGDEIAGKLAKFNFARRSQDEKITADTEIYLADTMGELGLFYRISQIVFIGGSLVNKGGQSPLEAAKLGSSIIIGKYYDNFSDIIDEMHKARAIIIVDSPAELTFVVKSLLTNGYKREQLSVLAAEYVKLKSGIIEDIIDALDLG